MSSQKKDTALSALGDRMKSGVQAVRQGLKRGQLEAELAAAHLRLGKAVADEHAAQPFLPQAFEAELKHILALREAIAATRHSPEEGRPAVCANCQRPVSEEAAFCPGCGQRIG